MEKAIAELQEKIDELERSLNDEQWLLFNLWTFVEFFKKTFACGTF